MRGAIQEAEIGMAMQLHERHTGGAAYQRRRLVPCPHARPGRGITPIASTGERIGHHRLARPAGEHRLKLLPWNIRVVETHRLLPVIRAGTPSRSVEHTFGGCGSGNRDHLTGVRPLRVYPRPSVRDSLPPGLTSPVREAPRVGRLISAPGIDVAWSENGRRITPDDPTHAGYSW